MSQSGAERREPDRAGAGREAEPDVLLDVPRLSVDSIRLAVDGLDADLSLRARLANLLQLDAGVRVHLEGVELDIEGVRAEALLKVRLEKLIQILDRALTTIDRNPEVIQALASSANTSLNDVNRSADRPSDVAAAPVADQAGAPGGQAAGQQVGSVGAVADRLPRGGGASSPGTGGAERPAGPRQEPSVRTERPVGPRPESPAGSPVGSPPEPPLGTPHAGPTEQPETEGDRPADRGATAGDRESRAATGGGPGQPQGDRTGQGQPGAGDQPGEGGAAQASQFAEQAGETLRQAGRSVWEAIQGGMAQRRQAQSRRDG